jgi:hypothetical protein
MPSRDLLSSPSTESPIEEEEKGSDSNTTISNSTSPRDNNIAKKTFKEWLLWKWVQLERKRYLIKQDEYEILIQVVNNRQMARQNSGLEWATTLIDACNLTVVKAKTAGGTGMEDILVKPKIQNTEQINPQHTNIVSHRPPSIDDTYFRVAHIGIIESIIAKAHLDSGHAGARIVYTRIKYKYIFLSREMVEEYKKRCPSCSKTSSIKKTRAPLNPIDGKGTFKHFVIDLIDFQQQPAGPDNEYNYIVHMVDHYSSFHYTEAIRNKTAIEVLHFLRRTFSITGYPDILHSDNGSEFVNKPIKDYLQLHGIKYNHGKPYTPTTQGKVERANRTMQEIIRKLVYQSNNSKTWFEVMYEATLCMNTNFTSSIRKSPYEHIYCQLPVNNGNISEEAQTLQDIQITLVDEAEDGNEVKTNDDDNELSPMLLEAENMEHKEIVEAIRDDSRIQYYKNITSMKNKYDRLRNIRRYNFGDLVAVVIPKDYVQPIANKLTAIVLAVEEHNTNPSYTLCYRNYRLENKYFNKDLVELYGNTYFEELADGSSTEEYLESLKQMHIKNEFTTIALKSAYSMMLDELKSNDGNDDRNENTSSANDINDTIINNNDTNDQIINHTDDIHSKKLIPIEMTTNIRRKRSQNTNNTKSVKIRIVENTCCVCKAILTDRVMSCKGCFRTMHITDECNFSVMHYEKNSKTFCGIACYLQQENYEVEITGENTKTKQYLVKYKNKATASSWKTYKQMESAEYAKMIHDWRLKHPALKEYDEDDGEVEIVAVNFANEICCVCNGILDADNWHSCYGCKRSLHGKIRCPKGHMMGEDDDKLYCDKCKKQ